MIVDLSRLTEKYRPTTGVVVTASTHTDETAVGMIADINALAVVNRDGLWGHVAP